MEGWLFFAGKFGELASFQGGRHGVLTDAGSARCDAGFRVSPDVCRRQSFPTCVDLMRSCRRFGQDQAIGRRRTRNGRRVVVGLLGHLSSNGTCAPDMLRFARMIAPFSGGAVYSCHEGDHEALRRGSRGEGVTADRLGCALSSRASHRRRSPRLPRYTGLLSRVFFIRPTTPLQARITRRQNWQNFSP